MEKDNPSLAVGEISAFLTMEYLFYYNDRMSFWRRLPDLFRLRQNTGAHYCLLEEPIYTDILSLAEQQGRSPDELVADILVAGLAQQRATDALWQRWQSLSPREQDVSALACLGHTNRQIAARLGISDETVKTHLRNALSKYSLHGRSELRQALSFLDFSVWGRQ